MARAPRLSPNPAAAAARTNRADLGIYLLLLALTLAVYSRSLHFDFVNLDDPDYVTDNPHVRAGLTWDGVRWAFSSFYAANWSPLTWLSHMADCQLFGVQSGWHHFSSVLLHAAAALLLFAALERLTAARWPSAFVALIFALHPLHVESVAWIAERKDVLCALFWFLALWSYARYAERPGLGRYLLVLVAFCLGLMTKPMIITLPFVLLLLDAWPLARLNRRAIWEKAPFFLLAGASGVITFLAQKGGHAVISLAAAPFAMRLENAIVAYAAYVGRMFWPANLAVFYPYPDRLPAWQVAAAGAALAAATAAVLYWRRARPYLATGWFWYLGTLVPVIGLVQVGGQASADRYTYVPMIGIAIMLAWGAADLLHRWPRVQFTIAAAVSLACILATRAQISYWRNSETLFRHALAVTTANDVAEHNLGNYLMDVPGGLAEAIEHLQASLHITPNSAKAHTDLGNALSRTSGREGEALAEFEAAVRLAPGSALSHDSLGSALASAGRLPEAISEYQTAQYLAPDSAIPHNNMGNALAKMGRMPEAITEYETALRLDHNSAEAHNNLGIVLSIEPGRLPVALQHFEAVVRLKPDSADAHLNLGKALAMDPARMPDAIAQFEAAMRLRPNPELERLVERLRAGAQ